MIQYQKKNLTLGDNSEELLSEDSGGLPFMCHYDESRLFTGHHIPWHWHDWMDRERLSLSTEISCTPMTFLSRSITIPIHLTPAFWQVNSAATSTGNISRPSFAAKVFR